MKPATVNTYVASVKSFLGFAHRVGYTRFNAGPHGADPYRLHHVTKVAAVLQLRLR